VIDRKIFTLVISKLTPNIKVSKTNAKVNEEITIDGSGSSSNDGQITSYLWTIESEDLDNDPDLNDWPPKTLPPKTDKFVYKFKKPGEYRVSLAVEDGINEGSSEVFETITITSEPPVARIKAKIESENKPATVTVDGSGSFDPDTPDSEFTYDWYVDGQALTVSGDNYDCNDCEELKAEKIRLTFKNAGDYNVGLVVTDSKYNEVSQKVEQGIIIDKTIDVEWDESDEKVTNVRVNNGEAPPQDAIPDEMVIKFISKNAVAYEVDYGDGQIEQKNIDTQDDSYEITHKYSETGTYIVKVTVFDKNDAENSIQHKIYVSDGTKPMAALGVKINGENAYDDGEEINISRKDLVTFDASNSINIDGTGRRLSYSWDILAGQDTSAASIAKKSQQTFSQSFTDTGTYTVELTAASASGSYSSDPKSIKINVEGQDPVIRGITALPADSNLTTPVTVNLNANALDPDGKIVSYRWYYFKKTSAEPGDDDKMGIQITSSPNASLTIGTIGDEGDKPVYGFGVIVTDNENRSVDSLDEIGLNYLPELEVTNGPNESPTASFKVDRTNIMVGESVSFISDSKDTDGEIKYYKWDWEGDGFANNTDQGTEAAVVDHVFEKAAPNGIRVKLRVTDDMGSSADSAPVTIYVDAIANPPRAMFNFQQDGTSKKVYFTNTSTADEPSGATLDKFSWDFDIYTDTSNDGIKENDIDSTDRDPVHTFDTYGVHRTRLTVEDNFGNTHQYTTFVNLKEAPPATTTTTTPQDNTPSTPLDARLLTSPAASESDGKIHLQGNSGSVELDYSGSLGNVTKYIIDRNAGYDSNGNTIPDDDEDHVASQAGKWTATFNKPAQGSIRVKLTVMDSTGKKDSVEKEIVFDTQQ